MSLQRKLLAGYAIACLLILSQGWLATYHSRNMQHATDRGRQLATAQGALANTTELLFNIRGNLVKADTLAREHSSQLQDQQTELASALKPLQLDIENLVTKLAHQVEDFVVTSRQAQTAASHEVATNEPFEPLLVQLTDRSINVCQDLQSQLQQEMKTLSTFQMIVMGKSNHLAWLSTGLAIAFLAFFLVIFTRNEARATLLEDARKLQHDRSNQASQQEAQNACPALHNHDNSRAVEMPIDIDTVNAQDSGDMINGVDMVNGAGKYDDAMDEVLAYYEDLEQALHDQEEANRILEEIDLDNDNTDLVAVREKMQRAITQSQRSAERVSTAVQAMKKMSLPRRPLTQPTNTSEIASLSN